MAIPIESQKQTQISALQPEIARDARLIQILRAFRRDPRWWFGIVLLVFTVAAIFAPQVSPYDPLAYHPAVAEQAPSLAHLLGTDSLGRDQWSRVIYGTRISLTVGIASILLGGLGGTLLGMLAAYFKGWVDQVVAICVDALLAFPALLLAFALVAALGPS